MTIGEAPATVNLTADDSLVVVSDGDEDEEIYVELLDQYGNPSGYVTPGGDCYVVAFVVSAGGGEFDITGVDQVMVEPDGTTEVDYLSSMTTGVYTITGTS
jgi:hypothetical protein